MKAVVLALALALTGCAAPDLKPVRTQVNIVLKAPIDFENPRRLGEAFYLPEQNTCVVFLRKYPECLLHEIRHCFEGQWHPKRDTTEDC